jgi:hypothetical protein
MKIRLETENIPEKRLLLEHLSSLDEKQRKLMVS